MDERYLKTLEYDSIRERVAQEASCSLGVERALDMRPADDARAVRRQLDETDEARRILSVKGSIPLGGITDIRPFLRNAEIGATLSAEDLLEVRWTAGASRGLKAFLVKAGAEEYPLLVRHSALLGVFAPLESAVENAIAASGEILDRASPDLARIRSKKRNAENRLRDRLNGFLSGPLRSCLQDPVIVQRNDRACLPVKAEHRQAFGGIVHDTSSSGATLFIEPQAAVELGNEVREAEVAERQEVHRILSRLTELVRLNSAGLIGTVGALAEIDLIVARARYSDMIRAVNPDLTEDGRSSLLSARHPLIDPAVVVPIDVTVGQKANRILLITGPNTGGKTVTLKTVGLLTLMAQSGLHLPAARAQIHVFDQVFADIGDEQSIQQSLSTFSSHITNIAQILRTAGPNALILLDEIGAGTDPAEGAALARALLEHMLAMGACVVATTHYGELKEFAYTTPGVQNASVEFDDVSLRPTYRLLQGVPGSSNALAIAGRLGLPEDVLSAAGAHLGGGDASADIIRDIEEARRAALLEADAARAAHRDARAVRERAEQERDRFDAVRAEIRQKALEEARAVVRKAQDKAAHVIEELRRAQEQERAIDRQAQHARDVLRDLETGVVDELDELLALPRASEVSEILDRPLRAGDRVRVESLGLAGTLLEDPGDTGAKVLVQVGSLRVSVPSDQLRAGAGGSAISAEAPARKAQPRPQSSAGSETATMELASVPQQITLLGLRSADAVRDTEDYLETARAAGLREVRIVHGKGTGALRRSIHELLRGHPYVESYRGGDQTEGGDGATIALLKE